jgi:hypothetical protein
MKVAIGTNNDVFFLLINKLQVTSVVLGWFSSSLLLKDLNQELYHVKD